MKSKYVIVKGIVQGVGFRPFVYKLAVDNDLKGNVRNSNNGVYINIEGKKNSIDNFLYNLKNKSPMLSKIESVFIEDKSIRNYKDFKIIHSDKNDDGITLISPDIAICKDCIEDINNINDKRRYKYPFTNCTNCGPRYSIIKDLPYDRAKTCMEDFLMCNKCSKEYEFPLDRRFHAQPNCCKDCGPKIYLLDRDGKVISNIPKKIDESDVIDENEIIINEAKRILKKGKIIAIKGLGGFHLVCDGKKFDSIETLRKRKNRKSKPLALMMKDIDIVNKYCNINEKEKEVLLGSKKPILLLNKKNDILPKNISYKNNTLGVMIPYTPLHLLLFDEDLDVLVMTSGNISGLPIIHKNEDALENLKDIADYFLIHNRDIHIPVDDSVVKVILNEERVTRNARGYAPYTFKSEVSNILALGSHLKNTFSISKDNYIFMSQYIGNMEYVETLNNQVNTINHFKNIYNIKLDKIIYDNHPNFWHKDYIKDFDCEKIGVYHHHAHIVSCMFENNVDDSVIGLAFDGSGYGEDKNIWGSEFLICDYKNFKRVGHLKYMKMPGGDSATMYPWKMGLSIIDEALGKDVEKLIPSHIKEKDYNIILTMLKNNINCNLSSSMGRLFDGVCSILGFIDKISYEGEACIELENLANKSTNTNEYYDYEINYIDGKFIINTDNIIKEIIIDINKGISKYIIAMKFHNTVVEFSFCICKNLRNIYNINKVALSGGVFQNNIIFINLYNKLIEDKFEVLTHKILPCNDSSISIGQLIIGSNRGK